MKHWLLLCLLLPLGARAQRSQRVVVWFDSTHLHPHEIYRALVAADTVPNGPYKRFYFNGRLEAQTRYTAGQRDSVYVEFHPDRTRRLEATYAAGVRQGPFRTYYPGGKQVAQEGSFVNDNPSGALTTYHPDGSVKLQTTLDDKGQPNGPVRELYASGKPAAEVSYVNGQPNGPAKFFYASGRVQSEGALRGGLLSGSYKTFYDNESSQLESETVMDDKTGKGRYRSYYPTGQLMSEGTYAPASIVGRPVRNQRGDELTKRLTAPAATAALDGPATGYYASGKIRSKTLYRGGNPTGRATQYYESGQVQEETDYSSLGRNRKVTGYYDAPGPPRQTERQYAGEKPAGTWREYYPDGKTLRQQEVYNGNGRLQGERLTYFENSQPQTRQQFENGYQTGLGQQYYASGKLWKETTYVKNLLAGPYRELRDDGTLTEAGQYKNGKASGQWTYYKADGVTVERQVTFRDGRLDAGGPARRLNGQRYVPKPAPKKK